MYKYNFSSYSTHVSVRVVFCHVEKSLDVVQITEQS